MTIKQFIEAAVEGGWSEENSNCYTDTDGGHSTEFVEELVFLDPKAWEAVGKVKGWKLAGDFDYQTAGDPEELSWDEWKTKMANMVTFLIDKGSLEEYITTL